MLKHFLTNSFMEVIDLIFIHQVEIIVHGYVGQLRVRFKRAAFAICHESWQFEKKRCQWTNDMNLPFCNFIFSQNYDKNDKKRCPLCEFRFTEVLVVMSFLFCECRSQSLQDCG